MSAYRITFDNRSGESRSYTICMEPPRVSGGERVFINAWQTAHVPRSGRFSIQAAADFHACKHMFSVPIFTACFGSFSSFLCWLMGNYSFFLGAGSGDGRPREGTSVSVSSAKAVRLGTNSSPGSKCCWFPNGMTWLWERRELGCESISTIASCESC